MNIVTNRNIKSAGRVAWGITPTFLGHRLLERIFLVYFLCSIDYLVHYLSAFRVLKFLMYLVSEKKVVIILAEVLHIGVMPHPRGKTLTSGRFAPIECRCH